MNNQNNKKVILTVMFVAILTIVVIGTSFAFFNYTRTGSANTLKVGRISFNHTQDGTITLTNIFPMSSEEFENGTQDPSNNVTINIEGDTTYPNGVEYLVTAEDVNITVNDKRIPLTLKVTSTTDLGDNDEDYFTNRGGSTNIHKVLSGGVVVDGQYLVVGYIAPGQTGIDGSLNISAYINSDNIVISDTYDGTESDNMGTTNEWVGNKTVFTTTEWNSLSGSSNSLSFKIRVEANEGIWVEEATTPNLMNYINVSRSANIKEIRFIEETPLRMQRRYDASVGSESDNTKLDLTYQDTGKVLAWIEPLTVNPTGASSNLNIKPSFLVDENQESNIKQIDNETSYILYIASSGKTKWTTAISMFNGFTKVEKIVFENVDSSDVTSMVNMFGSETNLKEIIGLNTLDTSNVTSMQVMFAGSSNLISVDLSGMGSENLTNVENMFAGCTSLTTINMKNFNFCKISSLNSSYSPFYNLSNVVNIDLNGSNTASITDMSYMFSGCTNLAAIDLSNINTDNVTAMNYMFYNCNNLISADLSNIGSNKLTYVNDMFYGCSNLSMVKINSYKGNTLYAMFRECKSTNLKVIGNNLNNLSNAQYMFQNCKNLISLDLSELDTRNVINMAYMFYECNNLVNLNILSFDTRNVTSMEDMFYKCQKIKTLDLTHFDTSSITNMREMFYGCSELLELNISGLGNDNLEDVSDIFKDCDKLKTLNMSNFNFGKEKNIDAVFRNLNNCQTIDLSGSNMPSVISLASLFHSCTKLETVNLSNVNARNVTGASYMFELCSSLTNVIFDGINISNVESLTGMFSGCTSLISIDLSNLNTSSVKNTSNMFENCSSLQTIYVSNAWNTSNVTTSGSMFEGCTSLVGGNGTVYDSSIVDKTRAVIDTPTTPGYLTSKA